MSAPRFFVIQGGPSPEVILNCVTRKHGPPVRSVLGDGPAPGFVYSVVEFKRWQDVGRETVEGIKTLRRLGVPK